MSFFFLSKFFSCISMLNFCTNISNTFLCNFMPKRQRKKITKKIILRFTKCGGEFFFLFHFFFTAVDFFNNEQITLERQKKSTTLVTFSMKTGEWKVKKDNKNIKKTLTHDFWKKSCFFFLQFLEMDFSWRLNFECFKRIVTVRELR